MINITQVSKAHEWENQRQDQIDQPINLFDQPIKRKPNSESSTDHSSFEDIDQALDFMLTDDMLAGIFTDSFGDFRGKRSVQSFEPTFYCCHEDVTIVPRSCHLLQLLHVQRARRFDRKYQNLWWEKVGINQVNQAGIYLKRRNYLLSFDINAKTSTKWNNLVPFKL